MCTSNNNTKRDSRGVGTGVDVGQSRQQISGEHGLDGNGVYVNAIINNLQDDDDDDIL